MMNPSESVRARLGPTACLAMGVLATSTLVGCGEEPAPPPPPPVVEAPPPPPPPPAVTPIEQLMATLGIDARVRLPEDLAPDTDPERVAVLQFFDAMVRGDASGLSGMLAPADAAVLETMRAGNVWGAATEPITRVDLRTGQNALGDSCALAVFHTGMTFQPQLWVYEIGAQPEFAAEPTPPGIIDRLSGDDWIAAWYRILEEELRKAEEPDERIVVKSVDFDKSDEGDSAEHSGLPPRRGGGFPGRRPAGDPIDPPGLRPGG